MIDLRKIQMRLIDYRKQPLPRDKCFYPAKSVFDHRARAAKVNILLWQRVAPQPRDERPQSLSLATGQYQATERCGLDRIIFQYVGSAACSFHHRSYIFAGTSFRSLWRFRVEFPPPIADAAAKRVRKRLWLSRWAKSAHKLHAKKGRKVFHLFFKWLANDVIVCESNL
jgi:hypothetical protein